MNISKWSKEDWAGLILSFAIPLTIYLLTMCRVIAPYLRGDAGELGTAVFVFGIPHPPGYPFYTILGKFFDIFSFFPRPITTYNLISAIFSALTISLVYLICCKITKFKTLALSSALIIAFLPVFWAQSTIAEVYTVYTFFLALLIYLSIAPPTIIPQHLVYLVTFIYGISISHHLIMVILLPSLLLLAISHYSKQVFRLKPFIIITTLMCLGFMLYSTLSIRANADPPSRWPKPKTFNQLVDHVSSRTYKEMFFSSTTSQEALKERSLFIVNFLKKQIFPIYYFLGLIGLYLIFKDEKILFYYLVLLITLDLLYSQFINVGDILAVGLASLICISIAFTKALDSLIDWLQPKYKYTLPVIISLLFLVPIALVGANYKSQDLSSIKNEFKIKEYTQAFYTLERGEQALKSGNKEKAYQLFDQATTTGHYLVWLQEKIADYNLLEKRYQHANKNYQNILKITPQSYRIYSKLAYSNELSGNLTTAADYYLKALELAPEIIDNYINLSLVYDQQKEYNLELHLMERAIGLAPEHIEVNFNYARALGKSARPNEAILIYRKLIKNNPDYLAAYYNLALLLEKSKPNEAISVWRQYLKRARQIEQERPFIKTAINHLEKLGGTK